jgi:hypothetical protein
MKYTEKERRAGGKEARKLQALFNFFKNAVITGSMLES